MTTAITFGLTAALGMRWAATRKSRQRCRDAAKGAKKGAAAPAPWRQAWRKGARRIRRFERLGRSGEPRGGDEAPATSLLSTRFLLRATGSVAATRFAKDAQQAGQLELHLWCEQEGGTREPLPGSPFPVHVNEGGASAVGSFVREAEAGNKGGEQKIVAGEHVSLKPQVHDQFGNPTSAPEGALTAVLDSPGHEGEALENPKLRSGLGTYEVIVEPLKSGQHSVHILLYGQDITGSPVSLRLAQFGPPGEVLPSTSEEPTLVNHQCGTLTTHDKHGNQLDRGGVRVDAKLRVRRGADH